MTGGKLTTFRVIALDVLAKLRACCPTGLPICTPEPIFAGRRLLDPAISTPRLGPLSSRYGARAKALLAVAEGRIAHHRRHRSGLGRIALGGAQQGCRTPARPAAAPHPTGLTWCLGRRVAAHRRHRLRRAGLDEQRWSSEQENYLALIQRHYSVPPQSDEDTAIMANEYLLSIDNGTQSVRALLFDLKGIW